MRQLWGNLGSNHEKLQGLNGAFVRLENQKVCRVSNEYIKQMPYKLNVIFSLMPIPIPTLSMLHTEKGEGLVDLVMSG